MSFDQKAADFLSRETGIDPAFIEKDWHAVRVLKALSNIQHDTITSIFSGGTSLSKAHGLIKRFSEDLDFRVRFDSHPPPPRAFREHIITTLQTVKGFSFTETDIETHGLGFKIQLTYPKQFNVPGGLRPELQIEFSYSQPELQAETQNIRSMMRHLHDLCALKNTIDNAQTEFIQTSRNSHNTDQQRLSRYIDMSLHMPQKRHIKNADR